MYIHHFTKNGKHMLSTSYSLAGIVQFFITPVFLIFISIMLAMLQNTINTKQTTIDAEEIHKFLYQEHVRMALEYNKLALENKTRIIKLQTDIDALEKTLAKK